MMGNSKAYCPAMFLDRDGVIIENRENYVRAWDEVSVLPRSMAALRRLAGMPFKVFIVTNQSAVGRGLVTRPTVEDINARLVRKIERAGGRIDGIYMCPHAPEMACRCRKPEPGLLLEAAADHDIDLGRSFLIGDAASDILAGRSAGIGHLILVRTGRGRSQESLLKQLGLGATLCYDSLHAAISAIARDASAC